MSEAVFSTHIMKVDSVPFLDDLYFLMQFCYSVQTSSILDVAQCYLTQPHFKIYLMGIIRPLFSNSCLTREFFKYYFICCKKHYHIFYQSTENFTYIQYKQTELYDIISKGERDMWEMTKHFVNVTLISGNWWKSNFTTSGLSQRFNKKTVQDVNRNWSSDAYTVHDFVIQRTELNTGTLPLIQQSSIIQWRVWVFLWVWMYMFVCLFILLSPWSNMETSYPRHTKRSWYSIIWQLSSTLILDERLSIRFIQ